MKVQCATRIAQAIPQESLMRRKMFFPCCWKLIQNSVFWWKPLVDMIGFFWFSRRRFSGRISCRPEAEK